MVVDLPDPFGPRNPVTRPGRTSKLSASTASREPNRLVKPRASIIAMTSLCPHHAAGPGRGAGGAPSEDHARNPAARAERG